MDAERVFRQRGAHRLPVTHHPVVEQCEFIAGDAEFVVRDRHGHSAAFRVPNAISLNSPEGMFLDAVEACARSLPPITGFWRAFQCHFGPDQSSDFAFNLRVLARSGSAFNTDNPGHVLLAMRGLTRGDDPGRSCAAFINALGMATNSPGGLNPIDPQRIIWYQAGICKLLGACYSAPPVPRPNFTVDHISILTDAVEAALPPWCPRNQGFRDRITTALREWHCPKFVRREAPFEAKRWSFERSRERAVSFATALHNAKF